MAAAWTGLALLLYSSACSSAEVFEATMLPRTWNASEMPVVIESQVDPPALVTHVVVYSDWWMKRPKDLEILLLGPNGEEVTTATTEFPTSLEICGARGEQHCSHPETPTSAHVIAFSSYAVASVVRVTVVSPRNRPGQGNDHVIMTAVEVTTSGQTTTPIPAGNVLFQIFSGGVDCGHLPDLKDRKIVHTLYLPNVNLPLSNNNKPKVYGFQTGNNWVARFTGTLSILLAGSYTFSLSLGAADTAILIVDGTEVVRSGCAWTSNFAGVIKLEKGLHSIQVLYADDGWPDKVVLSYSGKDSGMDLIVVPPTAFGLKSLESGPIPETNAPAHRMSIELVFSLQGLDYAKLAATANLLKQFNAHAKEAIAREVGHNVTVKDVTLQLSAGSLVVKAIIMLSSSAAVEVLRSSFDNSVSVGIGVAADISQIPGIDSVSVGVINASMVTPLAKRYDVVKVSEQKAVMDPRGMTTASGASKLSRGATLFRVLLSGLSATIKAAHN